MATVGWIFSEFPKLFQVDGEANFPERTDEWAPIHIFRLQTESGFLFVILIFSLIAGDKVAKSGGRNRE